MKLNALIKKIDPETLIVFSLFITYFIFGILKVIGVSPVQKAITDLLPWAGVEAFMLVGIAEVILAVGILIPRFRNIFAVMIILHLIFVSLFSVFVPNLFFSSKTILTVEAQFVLKNLVYLAATYYLIWKRVSGDKK